MLLVTSSATGEGQETCLSAALIFEVACHFEEAKVTMSASVVLQMSI